MQVRNTLVGSFDFYVFNFISIYFSWSLSFMGRRRRRVDVFLFMYFYLFSLEPFVHGAQAKTSSRVFIYLPSLF